MTKAKAKKAAADEGLFAAVPGVKLETDAAFRERVLKVTADNHVDFGIAQTAIGLELDEVGSRYGLRRYGIAPAGQAEAAGKGALVAPPRKRGAAKGEPAAFSGPPQVVPVTDAVGIMQMIERLAGNPAVDPEKFERLLAVQERLLDRNAKVAFDQAFVAMQPRLPIITRDGRIVVREKDAQGRRTGEKTQDTPYARWETIDALVKPILHEYGFALSHRIGTVGEAEKRVRVTAILRHAGGHTDESCYFDLGADTTGSKNNNQAWASSVSYAKRHTACAVVNIITKGEDDDGKTSGRPVILGEPLTEEEVGRLVDFVEAVGCPRDYLIDHLNKTKPRGHPDLARLDDLPRSRLEQAIADLRGYEANRKARDADAARKAPGGKAP